MAPVKTTSEEVLLPFLDSPHLASNNVIGRSPFIARLLIFCIFIFIFRQTVLLFGRSISKMAVVDTFAILDIAIVALTALILIASGNLGRIWSKLKRTPVMWLGLYYVFCAISCLWSVMPDLTIYRAFEYLIFLSATLTIVDQYQDFIVAERGFLRIAVAVIILEMCITLRSYGFTLSVEAWHNTTYTVSSAMLFCYCLGEYLAMNKVERAKAKIRSRRLLRFGIFAFCTLVLGGSSGSNIAAAVGCLLIFLGIRRFWLLLSGVCAGLMFFLLGRGEGILHTLFFSGKSELAIETVSGRASLWEFLWDKFLQKPALGYGFGLTRVISKGLATHSHNALFSVLIGSGLAGLFLFVLFALPLWWNIIGKVWRRGMGTIGSAAALAAIFVNSMSLNVMADRWTTSTIIFVWLLGLFFLHIRDMKVQPSPRKVIETEYGAR